MGSPRSPFAQGIMKAYPAAKSKPGCLIAVDPGQRQMAPVVQDMDSAVAPRNEAIGDRVTQSCKGSPR